MFFTNHRRIGWGNTKSAACSATMGGRRRRPPIPRAGCDARRPDLTLATADHSVPTSDRSLPIVDELARAQVERLERNCATHGIPLHGMHSRHQGIVHVIGPELGLTQPGMTIVCGDSHTSTHGAFRALSMEQRMTICNMSIEGGARAGMVAPDDTTFEYVAGRPYAPRGQAWERAVADWRTLPGDDGARFDRSVPLEAGALGPMVPYRP